MYPIRFYSLLEEPGESPPALKQPARFRDRRVLLPPPRNAHQPGLALVTFCSLARLVLPHGPLALGLGLNRALVLSRVSPLVQSTLASASKASASQAILESFYKHVPWDRDIGMPHYILPACTKMPPECPPPLGTWYK